MVAIVVIPVAVFVEIKRTFLGTGRKTVLMPLRKKMIAKVGGLKNEQKSH
jgi:hypothetical protein